MELKITAPEFTWTEQANKLAIEEKFPLKIALIETVGIPLFQEVPFQIVDGNETKTPLVGTSLQIPFFTTAL